MDEKQHEILETLREIRDGQRQIIELLSAQRANGVFLSPQQRAKLPRVLHPLDAPHCVDEAPCARLAQYGHEQIAAFRFEFLA